MIVVVGVLVGVEVIVGVIVVVGVGSGVDVGVAVLVIVFVGVKVDVETDNNFKMNYAIIERNSRHVDEIMLA